MKFPVTVHFEDGEEASYADEQDLEMNLEDFDSHVDTGCKVTDARGRPVRLKVKLLELKELSLK